MSQGLTTYDFVQQVYYAQEKVVLDFWPTDDKFKEVLFEANLVLQELQNAEDWTWLRERIILGDMRSFPNDIPEFQLPDWAYKPSTMYSDSLKLYRPLRPGFRYGWHDFQHIDNRRFVEVPFVTAGNNQHRKETLMSGEGQIHTHDKRLKAVLVGDIVTFNRVLYPRESLSVAVMDVQRRLPLFHICDEHCTMIRKIEKKVDGEWIEEDLLKPVCSKDAELVWKRDHGTRHLVAVKPRLHLTEIPDPNYVVMQTAARHAEGSPPAQGRIAGLQDTASKILSAMRQNDASATEAEYMEWDIPGYWEVV